MKSLKYLAISSIFILSTGYAQSPVYTTLNSDGKNIFTGVKIEKKDYEPETYIQKISADTLSQTKIPLPKELSHRDIIAIFTAEKNLLVVMTQKTIERGDNPQFYTLNHEINEWKKIGDSNCISFAKVKVEKNSITIHCIETNDKGERTETPRKLVFESVVFTQVGEITLPSTSITKDSIKAELLGDPFEWRRLKVNAEKKEKFFHP